MKKKTLTRQTTPLLLIKKKRKREAFRSAKRQGSEKIPNNYRTTAEGTCNKQSKQSNQNQLYTRTAKVLCASLISVFQCGSLCTRDVRGRPSLRDNEVSPYLLLHIWVPHSEICRINIWETFWKQCVTFKLRHCNTSHTVCVCVWKVPILCCIQPGCESLAVCQCWCCPRYAPLPHTLSGSI